MSLSFYEFQLVCLVALCLFFMLVERQLSPKRKEGVRLHDDLHAPAPALHKLSRQYLTVYAIVMGMLLSHAQIVSRGVLRRLDERFCV